MELQKAILARRSTRKFQDKAVPQEMIQEMLISGMAGPSAVNCQPWCFYVVQSQEVLDKLHHATRYSNMNSPLIICVAGDRKRMLPGDHADFWVQDCSAATENILLTATDLGLGSCWCGVYPNLDAVKAVQQILGVDETIIPLGLLQIGFPAQTHEPKSRFDPEKVHYL